MSVPNAVEDRSNEEQLVFTLDAPHADSLRIFAYWVEPTRLAEWWAPKAEIEAHEGGTYRLSWPDPGWIMTGRISRYIPPTEFGFTFAWSHEPDTPTTDVSVSIEELAEGGCRLTLIHSRYPSIYAGRELRRSHQEGWLHFLPRLFAAISPEKTTT